MIQLTELQSAVAWMNADADGEISVYYRRQGTEKMVRVPGAKTIAGRYRWTLEPDGRLLPGPVWVQWDRPGHGSRIIGHFETTGADLHEDRVTIEPKGKCPVMRWVYLYRLTLSDIDSADSVRTIPPEGNYDY